MESHGSKGETPKLPRSGIIVFRRPGCRSEWLTRLSRFFYEKGGDRLNSRVERSYGFHETLKERRNES